MGLKLVGFFCLRPQKLGFTCFTVFCQNGVATIWEGRFSGIGCAGGEGFVWLEAVDAGIEMTLTIS